MALVVSIRRNTYVYIHTFIIARLERKRQTANESERGRTQYAGRGLRVYRAIVSVERLVFNKTNYCDQDRGWRVGIDPNRNIFVLLPDKALEIDTERNDVAQDTTRSAGCR
jgi:hypothetical protein